MLLVPQLCADKLQHTARNTAGFIRDQETVGKLFPAGVHISHLEPRSDRVAAAQQTAQDAADLCGDREGFAFRRPDLCDDLPCFHQVTDLSHILKDAFRLRMDDPLLAITADDTRNTSVRDGSAPPG